MLTKVNIDGYTYTYNPTTEELVLTQYTGSDIDTATPIIETENKNIITINPTPADATVILTAPGYEQQGNMIIVDPGTQLTYIVSRYGYETQINTITVNENATIDINLVPLLYTITIDPHPSSAQVALMAPGYEQLGNSITVPYGTTVFYRVSKLTYEPSTGAVIVTRNQTIRVNISRNGAMGMLYNYGTCVVCFSASTKVLDLGEVRLPEDDSLDMGATTEIATILMDFGDIGSESEEEV